MLVPSSNFNLVCTIVPRRVKFPVHFKKLKTNNGITEISTYSIPVLDKIDFVLIQSEIIIHEFDIIFLVFTKFL